MPWVQASALGGKLTKILTVTDITEALRGEMTHDNISTLSLGRLCEVLVLELHGEVLWGLILRVHMKPGMAACD